jgi:hypothetical protein
MLKLQYNKRSAYIEGPNPPSSKRRPHFETLAGLGEINILVMDLEETETRNDSTGANHKQFNRQTHRGQSVRIEVLESVCRQRDQF